MNAMALLALKFEKRWKNDSTWRNTQKEQKIKPINPTAEILPFNLTQTFASGS